MTKSKKHGYLTLGDLRRHIEGLPDDTLFRVDLPAIHDDLETDLWVINSQYDEAHPGPGGQEVNRLRLFTIDASCVASRDNPEPGQPWVDTTGN